MDIAKEKEFGYGLWLSPWKAALARRAIKTATRVLVVDQSLKEEVLGRVNYRGDNVELLPTGYDQEFWHPAGSKDPIVLTVAAVLSEGRFRIKGIDILFDAARMLPDVRFELIGVEQAKFKQFVPPPNVTIHPILSQSELLMQYQRAKVYCQPSRREGLSNTLCEAMLCGCVPVATDVGGSVHALGENGVIVRTDDPSALATGIRKALELPTAVGANARERIATQFPKTRREQRLRELMNEMSQ